jgi:hypothetical protein
VPETREVFLEPWRLHRKAFDQLKQPSKAARETAASLKEFYQAQLSLFVEAAEEPGEAYEVLQKEFADFVDGWAQQDVMELFLEQGERGEERATGPPEKNKEEEESERRQEKTPGLKRHCGRGGGQEEQDGRAKATTRPRAAVPTARRPPWQCVWTRARWRARARRGARAGGKRV